MPPLVSVIVAAYNVEDYIGQCLESLIHQALADVEIIVVDDVSTDGTARILAHFAQCHPNLRLIRHDRNRGLSAVRNTGMESAQGKYLAFIDGDDWADPNMLAALVRKAETAQAEVVMADFRIFDTQTIRFGTFHERVTRSRHKDLVLNPTQEPWLFRTHNGAWRKLYLRSFVENEGLCFLEGNIYEDVRFHFAAMLSARRVAILDEPVYFYRTNRPGQIIEMKDERVLTLFDSFEGNESLLAMYLARDEVWWSLLEIECVITDWVLKRTKPAIRPAFLQGAAAHFAKLPRDVWKAFCRFATVQEIAFLLGLRLGRDPGSLESRMAFDLRVRAATAKHGPGVLTKVAHKAFERMKRSVKQLGRRILSKSMLPEIRDRVRQIDEIQRWFRQDEFRQAGLKGSPCARFYTIFGQTVALFDRPSHAWTGTTVQRIAEDVYLAQFVTFRPGDIVVDVGAHIGAFAIPLAKKYPHITVYAIEPDPDTFRLLQQNIEANHVGNVVAVECALGVPRRASLFKDCTNGANATLDPTQAQKYDSFTLSTVEVISPEALREKYGIGCCRMLKVSAPGSTREILSGLFGNTWVDFLAGVSDGSECPTEFIEATCKRVATAYCWRLQEVSGGSTGQSCLFHGGHATHRLLQAEAIRERAA